MAEDLTWLRYVAGVATELSLLERLSMSVAELDSQRLQERFAGVDVSSIAAVAPRRPARFGGEIRSQHRSAADGRPMLRVVVSDGSATAVAVFTGRTRIRGLEVGRAVLLEGVARRESGRLVVVNPAYTLIS